MWDKLAAGVVEQGWLVDVDTEVKSAGDRRSSRAARDLLPVSAAAGAAALFVTLVVGGSTSELHTAGLGDGPATVVDGADESSVESGRAVTVRVTPRAPRGSGPAALPADAGTLFDLASEPAPPAAPFVVATAPAGLARITFPFTRTASEVAAPATAVAAEVPGPTAAVEPVAPAAVAVEAPAAVSPERGQRPAKTAKSRTRSGDQTVSTTSSAETSTVTFHWLALTGSETAATDDGAKDKGTGKGKAHGRVEDPPPEHSQADEHAKARRS